MQRFYVPEPLQEHHARLSHAAARRRELAGAASAVPRWRRAVGGVLVRAGNRLIAEQCDLAYVDRTIGLP